MGGKPGVKENSNGGVNGMSGIDMKALGVADADRASFGFEEMKLNYKLEEMELYGTVGNVSVPLIV